MACSTNHVSYRLVYSNHIPTHLSSGKVMVSGKARGPAIQRSSRGETLELDVVARRLGVVCRLGSARCLRSHCPNALLLLFFGPANIYIYISFYNSISYDVLSASFNVVLKKSKKGQSSHQEKSSFIKRSPAHDLLPPPPSAAAATPHRREAPCLAERAPS